MSSDERKVRLSKAEASEKLIASTIELMRDHPIGKISALKICAHAGLDKMTVRYCFGSYMNLLLATASTLGRGMADHIHEGIFDMSAYTNPDAKLYGKLVTFVFASLGNHMPDIPLEQLPSFIVLEKQIMETYGIAPELARAMAKRTALVAVATAAMDHFVPVTERERELLRSVQRLTFIEVAKVQDEILG